MGEVIKHAAVKTVGGFISIGKCHADCFFQIQQMGLRASRGAKSQGFMTSKGRYVQRDEAARIARRAKQIKLDVNRKKITCLLSEDIWYRKDIIYCSLRGYCEVKGVKP